MFLPLLVVAAALAACGTGQRITTIQLDGVQYFISRMNPYSPELNYFLAYQYCRSIGLQLASFETKEKSDSIMQYLINAGYNKYDFWTSGNRLGTDMLIWMSTGLPFNATFDYMKKNPGEEMPVARQLGAVEQRKDSGASSGCVLLRAPDLQWDINDCTDIKDFICEQTRCYYYNYGSIPVSSAQGVGPVKGRSSSMPLIPSKERSSTTITTTIQPPQTPETTSRIIPQEQTQTTPEYTTEQPEEISTASTENLTEQQEQMTTLQNKARLLSRSQQPDNQLNADNVPWTWARNIMLEKPVLKKTVNL